MPAIRLTLLSPFGIKGCVDIKSVYVAYRVFAVVATNGASPKRSRAVTAALKREGHAAASKALSKQATTAARKRTASERSAATREAANTKGPAVRSAAARKAARTRNTKRH